MIELIKNKVITSRSAEGLNGKVTELIGQGWFPVGGHKVVESNHQLRFSGSQHHDTIITLEYSQTMRFERNVKSLSDDELTQYLKEQRERGLL